MARPSGWGIFPPDRCALPLPPRFPSRFRYGDQPSSYLLKMWELNRSSRRLDDNRTEHTLTYTDPKSGLVVRCGGRGVSRFPRGRVDALLPEYRHRRRRRFWRTFRPLTRASNAARTANSSCITAKARRPPPRTLNPLPTAWSPRQEKRISAAGGRPTNTRPVLLQYRLAGRRHDRGPRLAGPMGGAVYAR